MVGPPSLGSVVIAAWGTRGPEGLLQERRAPRPAPPGACSPLCVRHYSDATDSSRLADGQGPASQSRSPPPPAAATPSAHEHARVPNHCSASLAVAAAAACRC